MFMQAGIMQLLMIGGRYKNRRGGAMPQTRLSRRARDWQGSNAMAAFNGEGGSTGGKRRAA